MLAKKLQPAQITDKTYVFFQYYGDSGFESRFALQDRSLEFIKIAGDFIFRSLTIKLSIIPGILLLFYKMPGNY